MRVEFRRSFLKDLARVKDQGLKERVKETISRLERASTLRETREVRKLRGSDRYYRIRIGDYRLGLTVEGDTVVFVRFLHRTEVYRYFP